MAADPKASDRPWSTIFPPCATYCPHSLKELGFTNVDEAEDGAIALQKFSPAVSSLSSPTGTCPTWTADLQTIRSTPSPSHRRCLITAEAKKENIIAAAGMCQRLRLHRQASSRRDFVRKSSTRFRKNSGQG